MQFSQETRRRMAWQDPAIRSYGCDAIREGKARSVIAKRDPLTEPVSAFPTFICDCGAVCVVGEIFARHRPALCSTCRAERVHRIIAARVRCVAALLTA